jgi:hypothetical protein
MIGGRDGYTVARQNLLHALHALEIYRRDAIVVVGAQAIYLQTHEADTSPFLPFTLDSDLAVDPRKLETVPPIRQTLIEHGYQHRADNPGLYWAPGSSDDRPLDGAAVDILVPEEFATGRGRRDARIPGDNERAARRVPGLEAALYDRDLMTIGGFGEEQRGIEAFVAGPAALIVAKAQKIADRGDERLKAKDASDVFLLLRAFDVHELGARFAALAAVEEIRVPLRQSVAAVREVFINGTKGRTLLAAAIGDDPGRAELLDAFRYLSLDLASAIDVFN